MELNEINLELQEASDEIRQEVIDLQYEDFLEEMYYIFQCDGWELELELYNELG
jgi:hypothetical protein